MCTNFKRKYYELFCVTVPNCYKGIINKLYYILSYYVLEYYSIQTLLKTYALVEHNAVHRSVSHYRII